MKDPPPQTYTLPEDPSPNRCNEIYLVEPLENCKSLHDSNTSPNSLIFRDSKEPKQRIQALRCDLTGIDQLRRTACINTLTTLISLCISRALSKNFKAYSNAFMNNNIPIAHCLLTETQGCL